jgi:hypothetical protein
MFNPFTEVIDESADFDLISARHWVARSKYWPHTGGM